MPTAGELCSGFWDGAYASPVADAYAAGAYALGQNATRLGGPAPLRAWTVRADQAVTPGPDGRPTVGYPAPTAFPLDSPPTWVATDLVGGPVLAAGVDFTQSAGYLWFETDPLALSPAPYVVWAGTTPVRAATMFYGPAAPPVGPTPTQAGTEYALRAAAAAACDSPCTGQTAEVVRDVWAAADGSTRVVTDIAGYRLGPADLPGVTAGTVLPPGSPLGTAWTLTQIGPGQNGLTYLTTPPAFHAGAVAAGITWYDTTVPTVVDVLDGRTRVRWALGGSPADVTAAWAASHAAGLASGRTLAQALDTRPPGTPGDPGPESLPATVNPLAFACRELFAGTAYLLRVRPARFGPAALSTADRPKAVRAAAGTTTGVVEWTDTVPAFPSTGP